MKKSENFIMRLTPRDKEVFRELAERFDCSQAEVLRRAAYVVLDVLNKPNAAALELEAEQPGGSTAAEVEYHFEQPALAG